VDWAIVHACHTIHRALEKAFEWPPNELEWSGGSKPGESSSRATHNSATHVSETCSSPCAAQRACSIPSPADKHEAICPALAKRHMHSNWSLLIQSHRWPPYHFWQVITQVIHVHWGSNGCLQPAQKATRIVRRPNARLIRQTNQTVHHMLLDHICPSRRRGSGEEESTC